MANQMETIIVVLVVIAIIMSAGSLWYGFSVIGEVTNLTSSVTDLTDSIASLVDELSDLGLNLSDIKSQLADIQSQLAPRATITVIGPWSGEEREAFMPVLNEFERRTGINVRYRIYRAEDLATILPAQFDAGKTPGDLIFMWPWYISELGSDGDALNVTDWIDESTLSPGALDPVKTDGTIYGGAYTGKVKPGFWYRKSFFETNNLTEPETWTEFEELLHNISLVPGIVNPIATGDGVGWPISDVVDHVIVANGSVTLQQDLIAGNVDWTSAQVKGIFNDTLVRWLEAGYFSEPIEWTTAVDLWWDGDYGLYFMGSWITGMVDNPDDLGVFSLPGTGGLVFAADYFFVPTYTEHLEEVEELFKFLISEDAQEVQVGEGGHLATNIGVSIAAYPPVDREVAELLEGVDLLLDMDDTIGGEFQTTFWDQLQYLWAHPEALDSVLEAIQEKVP